MKMFLLELAIFAFFITIAFLRFGEEAAYITALFAFTWWCCVRTQD